MPPFSLLVAIAYGECRLSPKYRLIWTVAMVIFIALFCTTSVLSYLAAISIEGTKCAGQTRPAGYLSSVADFLALPVFSAICVATLAKVIPAYFAPEPTETADSIIVFEFLSIRIGYGMLGFVTPILFLLVSLGASAVFCAMRYIELSRYCN